MSEEKDRFDEFVDEFLERFKKATGFDFKTGKICASTVPPKGKPLIQGYTAEQWQEIIDGGYLCEVSQFNDFASFHLSTIKKLREHTTHNFVIPRLINSADCYAHCRPAQIKGVLRPIFVEPIDKEVYVTTFDRDSTVLHGGHRVRYSSLPDLPEIKKRATKYIEA